MTERRPCNVPKRYLSVVWPVYSVETKSLLSFKVDTRDGFRQEDPAFKSLFFTAPKGHILCEALERGGCYF